MSDEGIVNVEDDGPAPADAVLAVPAQEAPLAAADPAAVPEAEQPAEVESVDVGGHKYVSAGVLGDLIAVRKELKQVRDKASRVDELEAYARDSKPYVEFLKANPGLMTRQQQPAQPAAPQPEVADPVAEQLAKTLDLYTPEGKPDLARGGVMSGLVKSLAREMAQGIIAPIQQESDQTKSARNFQVALGIKDAQGRSPSPQALTQIWRSMDPRQTADPNVASILALTALGLDSVSHKPAPQAPANPPLVTEGAGGAARRPSLSALETSIARDRGMAPEKWAENTKNFTPGRANQLED